MERSKMQSGIMLGFSYWEKRFINSVAQQGKIPEKLECLRYVILLLVLTKVSLLFFLPLSFNLD